MERLFSILTALKYAIDGIEDVLNSLHEPLILKISGSNSYVQIVI